MICSTNKDNQYIIVWYGIVDGIDFENVPYGNYEVDHMEVIRDKGILQLHFEYPELTELERKAVAKEAIGYSYPVIESLFIKYRNWEYIKKLLITKGTEELYDEIQIFHVWKSFTGWNDISSNECDIFHYILQELLHCSRSVNVEAE